MVVTADTKIFIDQCRTRLGVDTKPLLFASIVEAFKSRYPEFKDRDLKVVDSKDWFERPFIRIVDSSTDELVTSEKDLIGFGQTVGILVGRLTRAIETMPDSELPRITRRDIITPEVSQAGGLIGFDNLAGMDSLKEEIRRKVITPIVRGKNQPNGVLFYGPPGCGKTYVSTLLQSEINRQLPPGRKRYNLQKMTVPEVGVGIIHQTSTRIAEEFQKASENGPTILFIDEFDSFSPKRQRITELHTFKIEETNEMLQQLSDAAKRGILVVGCSNFKPEELDDAMVRSGRMVKILVPPPDPMSIEGILYHYLPKEPQFSDLKDFVYRRLINFSSSQIDELVKDALNIAGNDALTLDHLIQARATMKPEITNAAKKQYGIKVKPYLQERFQYLKKHSTEGQIKGFQKLAGIEDYREKLMKSIVEPIIDVMTNAERTVDLGIGFPSGVLLYGPKGTGKTTIARAIGEEIELGLKIHAPSKSGPEKIDFYEIKPNEISSDAQKLQDFIDKCSRPCIVFIDEFEKVAQSPNMLSGPAYASFVAQLLQILQEAANDGILIIAAANDISKLDEAMIRSGRFNCKIPVGNPDISSLIALFKHKIEKKKYESQLMDLEFLTKLANRCYALGFSRSAADSLIERARLLVPRDKSALTVESVMAALCESENSGHLS